MKIQNKIKTFTQSINWVQNCQEKGKKMLCNYSVSLILRAFLINMPEYMQLALTQCFIVQVQVSQISSTDQFTYFKYFLINMPEDAPCTDPNFLLNVSKISNIFFWLGQIRNSNISWSTCQKMQLALTHLFIDWFKYLKYFLLVVLNISNVSWWTCQKMQLALTHFFIDRFKYPATAQKWWLSYSRPLQLVANWTSQKTK